MEVRFVGQPFGKSSIGHVLVAALEDEEATEAHIAVAWGKASGLTRVGRSLADFRDRRDGNRVEIILGIDEGGATWEGLELARRISSEAFVYHDPGSRTFHSKVYVVAGPERAKLIVGSGNATLGGLFTNYEAAFEVTVGPEDPLLGEVFGYFDALKSQEGSCRALDEALLHSLRDGRYRIFSEADLNRRRREHRHGTADTTESIFAKVRGLTTPPAPQMEAVSGDEYDADEVLAPEVQEVAPAPAATDGGPRQFGGLSGRRGFYKRLSAHDASLDQSPGQIIIPIRFEEFFPPLVLQWDQLSAGGSRQSEVKFPARFRDGAYEKDIPEVRVIRYGPKPTHRRKNTELRFTFHDREVFTRFGEGDYIQFTAKATGVCEIERVPLGAAGYEKYDWLA